MTRLIDADALDREMYRKSFEVDDGRNVWNSGLWIRYKIFEEAIRDAPTVDAEPVRHGAWLSCDKEGYILTETALRDGRRWYGYKCSECNNIYHGNAFTKYCPNCGAKMDAERKEE